MASAYMAARREAMAEIVCWRRKYQYSARKRLVSRRPAVTRDVCAVGERLNVGKPAALLRKPMADAAGRRARRRRAGLRRRK